MMTPFKTLSILTCVIMMCSCVGTSQTNSLQPLEEDFKQAYEMQRAARYDASYQLLKNKLHQRLKDEGDENFSQILAKQPYEIQIEVVNTMGFLDPSIYDRFPRTKNVLSATPKI